MRKTRHGRGSSVEGGRLDAAGGVEDGRSKRAIESLGNGRSDGAAGERESVQSGSIDDISPSLSMDTTSARSVLGPFTVAKPVMSSRVGHNLLIYMSPGWHWAYPHVFKAAVVELGCGECTGMV